MTNKYDEEMEGPRLQSENHLPLAQDTPSWTRRSAITMKAKETFRATVRSANMNDTLGSYYPSTEIPSWKTCLCVTYSALIIQSNHKCFQYVRASKKQKIQHLQLRAENDTAKERSHKIFLSYFADTSQSIPVVVPLFLVLHTPLLSYALVAAHYQSYTRPSCDVYIPSSQRHPLCSQEQGRLTSMQREMEHGWTQWWWFRRRAGN